MKTVSVQRHPSPLIPIEEPTGNSNQPSLRAFLELGFRPLYTLASIWAIVSVLVWVFAPQWLAGVLSGIAWHAHEMLWGFVATIAVGFLLTAAANWTHRNPASGLLLASLCGLWVAARIGFLVPGQTAFHLAAAAETLFFVGAALALAVVIFKAKSKRNYGIPLLVVALGASNVLFLMQVRDGDHSTLMQGFQFGLMTMALVALLIGRRVIPFFAMRGVPGLKIPMHETSGRWQQGLLAGALLLALLGQAMPASALLALSGMIAIGQLLAWKPLAVRHTPLVWVLYVGYGALAAGLLLAAAQSAGLLARGAWSAHVTGIGGFSVLIIGMLTRTSLGHLGRALRPDGLMQASFWLVVAAAVLRVAALSYPDGAGTLIPLSAAAWTAAFAMYLIRFLPWLIRPRIRN